MDHPKDLRPSDDRHTLVGQLARELAIDDGKEPNLTESPKDAWKGYVAAIISQTTTALLRGEYDATTEFLRELAEWGVSRFAYMFLEATDAPDRRDAAIALEAIIRSLEVMHEAATPYILRDWLKTDAAALHLVVLRTLVGQTQAMTAKEVLACLQERLAAPPDRQTVAVSLARLHEARLTVSVKNLIARYYKLSKVGQDVLAMLDAK